MIDALRGGSDEVDELGAEMRRRVDASGSLQDRYGSDVIDFFGAFLVGKMQEARDAARRLSVTQRSAGNDDTVEPPLLLGLAGASDDDVPSIDEALDRVRAIPVRSHVVIAVERCLDALLAARDGRPTETAARLYAEGLDGLRRLGHELWSVLVEIDAIGVLPADHPVATASLEHARAFAQSHGAVALAAQIDRRLERRRDDSLGESSQPARTMQNVLTTS